MQHEAIITDIRSLISEADMDAAFLKTRQWLTAGGREEALLQLDMIESEHNDVENQQINGLLDVDDLMRLQNINRSKLLQLLLQESGEARLSAKLTPPAEVAARRQGMNESFKNGLKNFLGVALFLPTVGALLQQDWALAACFGTAAFITFVPTLRLLEKTIGYELLSWQKYLLVIGALLAVGSVYKPKNSAQPPTPQELRNFKR